jgi:hypothetical protein
MAISSHDANSDTLNEQQERLKKEARRANRKEQVDLAATLMAASFAGANDLSRPTLFADYSISIEDEKKSEVNMKTTAASIKKC